MSTEIVLKVDGRNRRALERVALRLGFTARVDEATGLLRVDVQDAAGAYRFGTATSAIMAAAVAAAQKEDAHGRDPSA